jgi:hypothetical protein
MQAFSNFHVHINLLLLNVIQTFVCGTLNYQEKGLRNWNVDSIDQVTFCLKAV